MINEISSWASGIIISVIIVTIIEMILPEGKNKKYIKTILGIYILFTIISPIIKNTNSKEINIENLIKFDEYSKTKTTSIDTGNSISNIYEESLKTDIKNKLQQKGYFATKINLELELKDEKNYGEIYRIEITMDKINEEENKTINKVENIQIVIGEKAEEVKEKTTVSQEEQNEVKEYLSTTYNVKIENIIIV